MQVGSPSIRWHSSRPVEASIERAASCCMKLLCFTGLPEIAQMTGGTYKEVNAMPDDEDEYAPKNVLESDSSTEDDSSNSSAEYDSDEGG